MSLLRPIIRAVAVAALRNRTWCQDRVFNSDLTPLGEAILGEEKAQPYCCVYTDSDDLSGMLGHAEVYGSDTRRLSVVLEIGAASAVKAPEGGPITIQFSQTDEGLETAVDVVDGQCMAALFGDPKDSLWGDLFKRFVMLRSTQRRRGGTASEQGVRYAARRITLVCSTSVFEAMPGSVLAAPHPVRSFIELARADPIEGQVDLASIVEQLLVADAIPDWRQAQAYLGLSTDAIRGDGLTPLPAPQIEEQPLDYSDPNEQPPPLQDMTLGDDDAGIGLDIKTGTGAA